MHKIKFSLSMLIVLIFMSSSQMVLVLKALSAVMGLTSTMVRLQTVPSSRVIFVPAPAVFWLAVLPVKWRSASHLMRGPGIYSSLAGRPAWLRFTIRPMAVRSVSTT
ncbi:MAG: hypothetical protein H6Q37_1990 [Chloroflexi bacterium]|nr:hypothetical protein [Chloroflexota bacterium]